MTKSSRRSSNRNRNTANKQSGNKSGPKAGGDPSKGLGKSAQRRLEDRMRLEHLGPIVPSPVRDFEPDGMPRLGRMQVYVLKFGA